MARRNRLTPLHLDFNPISRSDFVRHTGRPACFLLAFICLIVQSDAQAQQRKVVIAVHVHSSISTGLKDPETAVADFRAKGVDAVVFTDSLRRQWSYGVWPLPKLIKRTVEQPSVLTYGARRYLDLITAIKRPDQPVVAIPAVEAAPFYYWARSPFDSHGGQIRAWQQHLLALGIDDPRVLEKLPLDSFDAYHGDQGAKPYQKFIDAVRAAGGFVYWAHPMTQHLGRHDNIEDYTEPYPHLLQITDGYTGFALTYLGYLSPADPGGLWDQMLEAYGRGVRRNPVWVIGELDWRGTERPPDAVLNKAWLPELRRAAVLAALREGKTWFMFKNEGEPPDLEAFSVAALGSQEEVSLGGTLTGAAEVRVHLAGSCGRGNAHGCTITIVRNGEVWRRETVALDEFDFAPTDKPPHAFNWYRVIVEGPGGVLYTNPVFVRSSSD